MGSAYKDDRSFLWTKGRQTKEGEYGDDGTKEMAEKVIALTKQAEDGSLVTEGSSDILSMALGNPEHSGRVRGLGFGITPTTYFNLPRRGSRKYLQELESKLHDEKRRRIEAEQELSQWKNQGQLQSSAKAVSNTQKSANINYLISPSDNKRKSHGSKLKLDEKSKTHEVVSYPVSSIGNECNKTESHGLKLKNDEKSKACELVSHPVSSIGKGKKCKLAICTKSNIVADGMVFERIGPHEKIHNVHLGEHNMRVSITKSISPMTDLPIPVDGEMNTIKEAVGSVVAWPKYFVLSDGCGQKESGKNDVGGGQKENAKNDDGECDLVHIFSQMLSTMKTDQIRIPIEKEMFGDDTTECFVFKKDLVDLCAMAPLDVTCIKAYMRLLYVKFESTREIVQFFNSESFNSASYYNKRRLIKERLENATRNQVCFIPFNVQLKFHWVLIVIDLSTMDCYWLDSKNITQPNEQIKLYVNTGLASLHIGEKRMPTPHWKIPKCPQQEGGVECVYFVMKFMRDLIADPSLSLETKMRRLANKDTYTLDEINEVRTEFIEFIVEHIPE